MAEETASSGMWKAVWTAMGVLLLVWSWAIYLASDKGDVAIKNMRLGEDAMWFFAAIFLMYFSYRLMVLSKGGFLEKGFLAFMLTFFIIVLWKFIGVNGRMFGVSEGLGEFKEILEGVSGLAMGGTFLYMYTLLKPK